MNYYKHIDRRLIQFDFLYFDEKGKEYKTYQKDIEELGGEVYFVPDVLNLVVFNKKLNNLLTKNHYMVVHIHDPFVLKLIYHTLRKNGVKHIIVHSHATKWSDKHLSAIRNRVICWNLDKYTDHRFACSTAAGEFLWKEKPFSVIYNGIDVEKYRFDAEKRKKIRGELKIGDCILFGHVGNYNNQKNHTFLIDVFNEILRKKSNSKLLLIGDGSLRSEIDTKISGYGIRKSVIELGKRYDVDLFYNAMDCLILPSLYEGLPMVGVEAQCNGVPVLFSDSITKEVGLVQYEYLSLKKDFAEWAERALFLAQNIKDRTHSFEEISRKGYDIRIAAVSLVDKYLKME